MMLTVYVDDQSYPIDVPEYILEEGRDFFDKMDRDMDRGWQMSRQWIDHPEPLHRCQIAADRLLTALQTGQQPTLLMMAAYILTRHPGVTAVRVDTDGDMLAHEILTQTAD